VDKACQKSAEEWEIHVGQGSCNWFQGDGSVGISFELRVDG
jgi:hypothetical protein